MVSSDKVLSKLAIYALPGAIFTTSFSFLLLAEERRHRINVVLSLMENARAIRGARNYRCASPNNSSLTERLAELGKESFMTDTGEPLHPFRRDKRNKMETTDANESASNKTTADSDQQADLLLPASVAADRIKDNKMQLDFWAALFAARNTTERRENFNIRPTTGMKLEQSIREAQKFMATVEVTEWDIQKNVEPKNYVTSVYMSGPRILLGLARALLGDRDNVCQHGAHGFELALALLVHLRKFRDELNQDDSLLKHTITCLLRYSLHISPDNLDSTSQVLEASVPLLDTCWSTLSYFLHRMITEPTPRAMEAIRHLLLFFTQPEYSAKWKDGQMILGLVLDERQCHGLTDRYIVLKMAGLFTDIHVSLKVERYIKRRMVVLAYTEGRLADVAEEMESLQALDAEAFKTDFELQACVVAQMAAHQSLEAVICSVRALEANEQPSSPAFQKLLEKVTDCFAQTRDARELEALMTHFCDTYGMTVQSRWAVTVFKGAARYRDLDSMSQWLQSCFKNRLTVDVAFANAFLEHCGKYWGFHYKDLEMMQLYTVNRLFNRLGKFADHGLWRNICTIFGSNLSRTDTILPECLRLALRAHITIADGETDTAWALLARAQLYGFETEGGMCALFNAEVAKGADVLSVMDDAVKRGLKMDAMSFLKVVDILRYQGKRYEAIDVLERAAVELGQGRLALNELSFASLLHLYMGTRQHEKVEVLLTEFMTLRMYWHGHKWCRESIKHAIKEYRRQSVTSKREGKPSGSVLDLLESAFDHHCASRIRRDYRDAVMERLFSQIRGNVLAQKKLLYARSVEAQASTDKSEDIERSAGEVERLQGLDWPEEIECLEEAECSEEYESSKG